VNIHYTDVDVVEQIGVEFHTVAGGEEDHYFFVFLLLQKSEQELKLFVCINHHKTLFQGLHCCHCFLIINSNVNRIFERQFG